MIRVGLVGIGTMGNVHYKAYKNIEGAEVVAVAEIRADVAKEKIGEDAVNLYSSMEEMMANEELDMIDICTPTYMHAPMSIKALEAGYHVICEKPMSLSSKDTGAMIEAAKKSGKKFMIAQVVRFMKPYEYLKSVVDSGELGKVVHVEFKRGSALPSKSWEHWLQDVERSGGTPIDLTVHDVDFAQYVFGQPNKVWSTYRKMRDNCDCITSNLVYDDFDILISAGWYKCPKPFKDEYVAVFEDGYIENIGGGKVLKNGEPLDLGAQRMGNKENLYEISDSGYENEIRYFVNAIINNTDTDKVAPESSEASIKLCEKILENAYLI